MRRTRALPIIILVVLIATAALLARSASRDGLRTGIAISSSPNVQNEPTTRPLQEEVAEAEDAEAPQSTPAAEGDTSSQEASPSTSLPSMLASDLLESWPGDTTDDKLTGDQEGATANWTPPSLQVPLALHPYDHYWFVRPVTSDHVNSGLTWYTYGSDGPSDDLRIHHGTDIANPAGVEIHAAGDGVVVWAGRGHVNEYETITSYGNTVVIEHDYGYQGEKLYTLYAHLSEIRVEEGDRVALGDVIALLGATGQVTGPHVHFEVRIGRNSYFAVRNPDLWLAPYAGTGVIAGRLTFSGGSLVEDADIVVREAESGNIVYRGTTYAGFGINQDDQWGENFVIPDVAVGRYLVTASYRASSWSGEVIVQEGMTNWVTLTP